MGLTIKGPCPSPKCGSSDAFVEFSNGSKHCFSCGYHEHPEETIDSIKESLSLGNSTLTESARVALPNDFTYAIPKVPQEWLDKYGITFKEQHSNRIGWSELKKSLVFPVFGGYRELILYQQRYFGNNEKMPKYVTYGHNPSWVYIPDPHTHDLLVVVEDAISAIKVCRVTNAMPLFGSILTLPMALNIRKQFSRVKIWLDPDMKQKAVRTALTLSELGCKTTVVFSDKDPKEYLRDEVLKLVDPLGKT